MPGSPPSAAPAEPQRWTLLAERPRTGGWIPVVTRTYLMPDGSQSDWDIHQGRDSVSVLALTRDGRVVAVREYRPGPDAVLLNLPGGLLDKGEDAAAAAVRELREETGYAAGHVEVVGWIWAFSTSTWRQHVVIARDCEPVADETSWGGDEYCQPVLVTVDELRRDLRSGGGVQVGPTYLALDAAGLF